MKLSRNDSRVLAMAILFEVYLFEKKYIDFELEEVIQKNIGSNSRKYTTTQFLQFSGCRPILRSYFQRRLHLSQQEKC